MPSGEGSIRSASRGRRKPVGWFLLTGTLGMAGAAMALVACGGGGSPSAPPTPSLSITPGASTSQAPVAQGSVPTGYAAVAGYGLATTTGGAAGATVTASTEAELIAHIASPVPLTIRIAGTITTSGMRDVSSNKTIEGVGTSGVINGGGLRVRASSNVIIRNLTLANSSVDGITIEGFSHHVWVDHCRIENAADGALDFTHGSDLATFSYNHFYRHDKVSLVGHDDTNAGEDADKLRASYIGNWFDRTTQRHPRVRFGRVHVLNNYYDHTLSYGIGIGYEANIYAESNYFDSPRNAYSYPGSQITTKLFYIFSVGHLYEGSAGQTSDNAPPLSLSWTPSQYYLYTAQTAAWVKTNLKAYAGVGKPTPS